jgi:hypothetical protein
MYSVSDVVIKHLLGLYVNFLRVRCVAGRLGIRPDPGTKRASTLPILHPSFSMVTHNSMA